MSGRATAAERRDLQARVEALEHVIRETLWMARRYADGRQSYSVGMYNAAARRPAALGVTGHMPDGSIFAIDGSLMPGMCGLSQVEFNTACVELERVGITKPSRFAAGREALKDGG